MVSEKLNKRHLVISFIAGVVLFLFSLVLGGGGHEYLLPLQLIFPIPALIGYFSGADIIAFMLCLVQFPIYMIIINLTRSKRIRGLFPIIHGSLFILIRFLNQ
jgi:hypothetical protein